MTTSDELGGVLGAAGFKGWKVCEACEFEYPHLGQDEIKCPRCHPELCEPPVLRVQVVAPPPMMVLDALAEAGVNVHRYQHATLRTFDGTDDPDVPQAVRDWITKWADTLQDRYPVRPWLYLYGGGSTLERGQLKLGAAGNGKTHMAVAVIRHLLESGALRPGAFRFVTAEALLLEMEATFRDKSTDSETRLLAEYGRLDLLVVDDLGVREPTPHAIRVLDELTKRREGRATIWTSNLSLKVLAKQSETLTRLTSRIAGEVGDGAKYMLKFTGHDRRIERSKGEQDDGR
jgi:hypothetical protein